MQVDIVILTIRDDEFMAVRRRFQTERQPIPSGRTYLLGEIKAGEQMYTLAIARCSEQGNDASQRLAHSIIHDLDPQLILVVGIAGGVPHDEFTLGDVIVSTRIINPNVDAWNADGTTDYMTRGGPPHPLVEDIVSLLPDDPQLVGWTDAIQLERPRLDPEQANIEGSREWEEKVRASLNWHFGEAGNRGRSPLFKIGPILSSNHLMKDPARLREVLKTHRSTLAVEMEAAGVYDAAYGIRHYPVLAIRGISDIVGLQRDKKWTAYACETAAAFAYAFVQTVPIKPQEGDLPKTKEQLTRAGEQHQATGHYAVALDYYEQALQLDAHYVPALRGKSLALYHLNRLPEALTFANEAIRLDPQDAEARCNRGSIFVGMGRNNEALAAYEEALSLDPNHVQANKGKMSILMLLIHSEEALSILKQLSRLGPNDEGIAPQGDRVRQEVASQAFARIPPGTLLSTCQGHTSSVWNAVWSPDGTRLATDSHDGTMRVWDAMSGTLLLTRQGRISPDSWSPDGTRLASYSIDGITHIWDAMSGTLLSTCQDPTTPTINKTSIGSSIHAWSSDGTQLTSYGSDGTVRIWDAASSELLSTYQGYKGYITAWSPDRTRVATVTATDNHTEHILHVCDTMSGKLLLACKDQRESIRHVAWSPDGSRLATAGYIDFGFAYSVRTDNAVRIWDATSGRLLLLCKGHELEIHYIAWSPDGSRLTSYSRDRTIRVWDPVSGKLLVTYRGHKKSINCFAWSPDGKRIASGSDDKTVQVWDAASGGLLFTCQGHHDFVQHVTWFSDGMRLASISYDRAVRVWKM